MSQQSQTSPSGTVIEIRKAPVFRNPQIHSCREVDDCMGLRQSYALGTTVSHDSFTEDESMLMEQLGWCGEVATYVGFVLTCSKRLPSPELMFQYL